MISMTGYGYREVQEEKASFSLELKSYNNRYLDIIINLPSFLNPLEPVLREQIGRYVSRGRVELNVRYHELSDSLEMKLDEEAVDGYLGILNQLREKAGIIEPLTLMNLQQVDGLIRTDRRIDLEQVQAAVLPVLDDVIAEFVASRKKEGEATQTDIVNKLERIAGAVERISGRVDSIEERVKDNLKSRFAEVLGDEIDMQRVYTETAVMLVRFSVSEELERLAAHIKSFREIAVLNEPVGKKLDFLSQEMNREINTIGSKNILQDVAQDVVDSKDALEQIREQLRNVE